jgi:cytochrome b
MRSTHFETSVRVWDPFVRVFHWSLVSCVVLNYFVVEDGETAHQVIGYIASGLVLARVAWGFVGSEYARFDNFFPTPARLRAHVMALRGGRPPFHPGHNPLGALMMIALMVLVLALGLTGFLQTTDAFWGNEPLQETHEAIASALIALAGLHAAVAIVMSRLERVNLVGAMFTGVKRRPGDQPGRR